MHWPSGEYLIACMTGMRLCTIRYVYIHCFLLHSFDNQQFYFEKFDDDLAVNQPQPLLRLPSNL